MTKNVFGPKFGSSKPKLGPKIVFFFFHFLKFGSLDFLGIAYNDSLQPCLTSCMDKTHEKKNVQIWAKIRSKLGQNFLKLSLLVFL